MTTDDYQAWWAQIDLCDDAIGLAFICVDLRKLREQLKNEPYDPALPNGWDFHVGLLLEHAQSHLDQMLILHFSEDMRGAPNAQR